VGKSITNRCCAFVIVFLFPATLSKDLYMCMCVYKKCQTIYVEFVTRKITYHLGVQYNTLYTNFWLWCWVSVELYLYLPSVPAWHVKGDTFTFTWFSVFDCLKSHVSIFIVGDINEIKMFHWNLIDWTSRFFHLGEGGGGGGCRPLRLCIIYV